MTTTHHSPTGTGAASVAGLDWTAFVETALVFDDPDEVLRADGLSAQERRAILASWASDAWAVESHPELKKWPGAPRPVPVTRILAALTSLDEHGRAAEMVSRSLADGNGPHRFASVRTGRTL